MLSWTRSSPRTKWANEAAYNSPKSLWDLASIARYIAADNPARTRSFVAELRSQTEKVTRRPQLYAFREDAGIGLRCLAYRRYLIFFRELEYEVRVVRVRHSAQDSSDISND